MSERKENAIIAMAELLRHKLSAAAVRMFVAASAELTDDQFERAAAIVSTRSRFFPAPCDLIEIAKTSGVSYEAQAALAFEQLDNALTQNRPSLLSPITAAVARQIGGFQVLHAMPLSEFRTWKRRDFLATYGTLAKENPQRLAALAGPGSAIGAAMLQRVPSRDEIAAEEHANRQKLLAIKGTP